MSDLTITTNELNELFLKANFQECEEDIVCQQDIQPIESLLNDMCYKVAALKMEEDDFDDKIKQLKEKKLIVSNEIDAIKQVILDKFGDLFSSKKYEYNGSSFALYQRSKCVYSEDFKDIENTIKINIKKLQEIQIKEAEDKYFDDNGKSCIIDTKVLVILRK